MKDICNKWKVLEIELIYNLAFRCVHRKGLHDKVRRHGCSLFFSSSFFHSLQPRKSASMLVWGWARTPTRIDPRRRVACLSFWILGMCFPSNLPTNTISTSLFRQSLLKEVANAPGKILISSVFHPILRPIMNNKYLLRRYYSFVYG